MATLITNAKAKQEKKEGKKTEKTVGKVEGRAWGFGEYKIFQMVACWYSFTGAINLHDIVIIKSFSPKKTSKLSAASSTQNNAPSSTMNLVFFLYNMSLLGRTGLSTRYQPSNRSFLHRVSSTGRSSPISISPRLASSLCGLPSSAGRNG